MKSVEIAIIGGSVGGCAAALAAAKRGHTVLLTEETSWIGGQLTSQAVPPDENPWIEEGGSSLSYQQFRRRVRDYYRRNYPLTPAAREQEHLNPGSGNVSRLCHEPKVALAVLEEMLAPYVSSGRIQIWRRHKPVAVDRRQDSVYLVSVVDLESGDQREVQAQYFLDATEMGDLLPLAKMEYTLGAESQSETGEPHALVGEADPRCQQSFTYCFAVDFDHGSDNTIGKPEDYEFWRSYSADFWPGRLLDWTYSQPITGKPFRASLLPQDGAYPLFHYRQILDQNHFSPGAFSSSISLVNWPQVDYWLGPIIDVDEQEREKHLRGGKQLSLSFLYWMQKEAPRHDGGYGYPELRLRPDIVGTTDGLAMYPYIRESRRIKGEFTVTEQHVSSELRGDRGAEVFADSVGIGAYRIDLHPSATGVNYIDIGSYPFQIPLGALLPRDMDNLLPACKNLSVTHITNGCYRLHPVEWNIGEAAGYLASFALERQVAPRQVRQESALLQDFQSLLRNHGVKLEWPRVRAL